MSAVSTQDKLFIDLKEEWPARLASINSARRFLYIATYYIDYDVYGIAFFDALKQALERGVRIYLLVDSFAIKLARNMSSKEQYRRLQESLGELKKTHNIYLNIYQPPTIFRKLCGGGVHVKFQISDRGEIFVSSGNITAHSYEIWKDISLYMQGTIAAEILATCQEYFPKNDVSSDIKYLEQNEHTRNHSYKTLHHNPNHTCRMGNIFKNNHVNPITNHICKLIDAADKSLLLSSFYFKPNSLILDALMSAARRGIKIGIIHSHISSLGCSEYPWFPCLKPLLMLLQHDNVDIYEDIQGQHSKFLVTDDKILLIGSYNFEHAAHNMVSEIMFETMDTALIEQTINFYLQETNKQNALKINTEYLGKIMKRIKWRYLLARPFLRFI